MKKLFIAMSIVAFGFASCGDASEEASGDEKKAGDAARRRSQQERIVKFVLDAAKRKGCSGMCSR